MAESARQSIRSTLPEELEAQVKEIVFAHDHVTQIHGFYLLKDRKEMRFDLVINFEAKDRRAAFAQAVSDVQKAFPDYTLQAAMDTDFSEE